MIRRRSPRWALSLLAAALTAGALCAASGGPSQPPARSPADPTVVMGTRLRFELVATRRGGATGAPRAEVADNLAVGDANDRALVAGSPGEPDFCSLGSHPTPDPAAGYYVWQVSGRVRSISLAQTTIDVTWRRSGPEGEAARPREHTEAITIDAGQFRVLDYVRAPTDSSSPCVAVQLQLRADPLPRPGEQPALTYDLWLVHEDARGVRSEHQAVAGTSGRLLNIALPPLAWTSDGENVGAASPAAITLTVRGQVGATLRADGTVDVSVRAVRAISVGTGEVRGQGQEDFRGVLGETAALLFPPPQRRVLAGTAQESRGALAHGTNPVGPRIDLERFFRGTRTSLYVRVTRR